MHFRLQSKTYQSGDTEMPQPQPTALHHAVEWNSLPMVSLLIKNGAEINAVSKAGETPFRRAVSLGHDKIASFLAERGGDVHRSDNAGRTAIYSAQEAPTPSLRDLVDRIRAIRG